MLHCTRHVAWHTDNMHTCNQYAARSCGWNSIKQHDIYSAEQSRVQCDYLRNVQSLYSFSASAVSVSGEFLNHA